MTADPFEVLESFIDGYPRGLEALEQVKADLERYRNALHNIRVLTAIGEEGP